MGVRGLNRNEKKKLKILADDFGLLNRDDVQEIIANCNSYTEGQKEIMRIYDMVYMHR